MGAEPEKSPTEAPIQLHDGLIRAIGVPVFGILIPNVTGLFGNLNYHHVLYWGGYGYFTFLSFLIWQGNRFFLLKQREYYNWFNHPVRKIMLLLFANVFYTAPLTVAMLAAWYRFAGFVAIDWEVIEINCLICVICVIFITHMYETVHLIRQQESDIIRFEKMERAKAQAELAALKNQIEPHFMFNSLNTLAALIVSDPDTALKFNESLADVYRYILLNKNRELVFLKEELDFLNSYFALLRLRFGNGLTVCLPGTRTDAFLIPPISLQILLENAVKHNEFSSGNPMEVLFRLEGDSILVQNPIRLKMNSRPSAQIGLKILSERYELVMRQKIMISDSDNVFTVQLPLMQTAP